MDKPKDVDEYISTHKSAVDQNPECGNSHYNLAVGYVGQRRFEEAERTAQRALGLVRPGTTQMKGARVASSQSANFRQWCFSPRCQPWSLQKQMRVLSR